MKWNIINLFWTYIFLILPKSIQRRFFHIFRKLYHANDSWRYILFIKNMHQKRVLHKRKLTDLNKFQKSLYFMLLFWRYSKICNSTPNLINNFPKSLLIVFTITLVTLQLLQHPRLGIWVLFLILPWPWNYTSPMSSALQHFNYETSAGFAKTLAVMPLNKLSILL